MGDAEDPKMEGVNDSEPLVTIGTDEPADKSIDEAKLIGLNAQIKQSIMNHIVSTCPVIPSYLKKKVKALKKLQLEHVHLESAFFKELHALELKYEQKFAPLYEKRKLFVTGAVEPTEEECNYPSDDEDPSDEIEGLKITEDGDKDEKKPEEIKDVKGIPEFWLTAFKHASVLAEIIEEHDEPILKHLLDVKATASSEPMGFMLEFFFSPNEFFTNTILTKCYEMKCDPEKDDPFSFDGPEIYKCTGCTIDWKKGMNVTVKTIKKKQKHKARGAVRMITRTVQNDSFFNFFNPPVIPEGGEEEMDEEQRSTLTADFEIGNYIKDNIIPQAVLFFTGENLVDDEYDEEDDEEEDEEFDEDDEDSENETGSPNLIKKGANPKSGQSTQTAPPECKQQ